MKHTLDPALLAAARATLERNGATGFDIGWTGHFATDTGWWAEAQLKDGPTIRIADQTSPNVACLALVTHAAGEAIADLREELGMANETIRELQATRSDGQVEP